MKPSRGAAAERGVALIVVLFALAAIALIAAATLRVATSADLTSSHLIAQTQAREAAQAALRGCERALLEDPPALNVLAAAPTGMPAAWQQAANWSGASAAVHSVRYAAAGDPMAAVPPQCLVEWWPLADTTHAQAGESGHAVLITARGFSADHAVDATGATTAGSVVWLQSILSLEDR